MRIFACVGLPQGEVQVEVASDKRIVVTDRLFEGAPRRCWKATAGLSPAPRTGRLPPLDRYTTL